jgi:hypothetical protein
MKRQRRNKITPSGAGRPQGIPVRFGQRRYFLPRLGLVGVLILRAERFCLECTHKNVPPAVLAGLEAICRFVANPRISRMPKQIQEAYDAAFRADFDLCLSLLKYLRAYRESLSPTQHVLLSCKDVTLQEGKKEVTIDSWNATAGEISQLLWEQFGIQAELRTINDHIEQLARAAKDCFDAWFRSQIRSIAHAAVSNSSTYPDLLNRIQLKCTYPEQKEGVPVNVIDATVSLDRRFLHPSDRRNERVVVSECFPRLPETSRYGDSSYSITVSAHRAGEICLTVQVVRKCSKTEPPLPTFGAMMKPSLHSRLHQGLG